MALMDFREENQVKWIGTRPGHNGTQVVEAGSATNAVVAVYTVPADVVFYLCSIAFNGHTGANAGTVRIQWMDAVPAVHRYLFRRYLGANQRMSMFLSYWPPIEIPTTHSVRVEGTAAGVVSQATINGWIE